MKTRIIIAMAALAGVLSSSAASAWDQDPFAMYIQRSDKITLGAGDAKDVNAATHVIDPSGPRDVGNRQIPANGAADGGGCRTLSHEHAVGHALSDYADI